MKMYTTPDTIQSWSEINFQAAENCVKKLQKRIAKAFCNDEVEKMAFLQNKLIHSFYAKALAVKYVTSNGGKNTPGIDDIIWRNPNDKFNAISDLRRRGYKPIPLKRIYIPKADGKLRPLSIPTMKDRAMQTLYKFALEPIGEATADSCSFAYLSGRSARDAIIRMDNILSEIPEFEWVIKSDIKACFDNISHEWVMEHIPMDKMILRQFLECGYIEKSTYYTIDRGVPQGGCISSVICNMTLDGLEGLLQEQFGNSTSLVRYADDIIIAGRNPNFLLQEVMPVLKNFLAKRGLTISEDKTECISVYQKIHFLGWEIYKEQGNIICRPPRSKINNFLTKISDIWYEYHQNPCRELCNKLSQQIRGWLSYYRGIAPLQILNGIEFEIVMLVNNLTGNNRLAAFVSNIFTNSLKDI